MLNVSWEYLWHFYILFGTITLLADILIWRVSRYWYRINRYATQDDDFNVRMVHIMSITFAGIIDVFIGCIANFINVSFVNHYYSWGYLVLIIILSWSIYELDRHGD